MNHGIDEFRETSRSRGLFERDLYQLRPFSLTCYGEEIDGFETEETCDFLALVRRGNADGEMANAHLHPVFQLNTYQKAVSL